MQICRSFQLLFGAGLLAAALSGCGGSSTSDHIPSTVTIFYEHSVLLKGGATYTMGYNGFGQLGDGTLTKSEIGVPVPGMVGMVKAVAGNAHTMVTDGSAIYAWGYNLFGQLGNESASTTYPDSYKKDPVQATFTPAVAAVTDIAAGGYHSLAVADGKLFTWGSNVYRQLGNSSTTKSNVPVHIATGHEGENLDALTPKQVAAGGQFSMTLFDNGDVYAWGNNRDIYHNSQVNQLVSFGAYSSVCSSPRKVVFAGLSGKIEQIAALANSSVALDVTRDPITGSITKETLWGWGYNDRGELGSSIPVGTSSVTPVTVHEFIVADATSFVVKKIVTGQNHILLLMGPRDTLANDGSWYVLAIGLNSVGQLGNGTIVSSLEFLRSLDSSSVEMTNVSDIAAFGKSSFALIAGVWYGWGNNSLGQLGTTILTDRPAYFELPVTVKFQ